MKEITRIHLARTPYNIEIPARKELEQYLKEVQSALDADGDTMDEIEARIVEILTEHGVVGSKTITTNDVDMAMSQLGEPGDFVDDTVSPPKKLATAGRHLMRDNGNAIFGGVVAGIAEYFDLSITGLRWVVAIVTVITGGALIVVYAALWIILKPTVTAADRLQLRGEAVTADALKRETPQMPRYGLEQSRPFVIALRIVLTIGFALAAVGALGLTIGAVAVRPLLFTGGSYRLGDADMYANWMLVAGVLAVFAGILFVMLMVLCAVASARWRVTRRNVTTAVVFCILGLVSFGTAVVVGGLSLPHLNAAIYQRVEKNKVSNVLPGISTGDARNLVIDTSSFDMPVEYHVTNGYSRVEAHYIRGQEQPKVTISKNKSTTTLHIGGDNTCNGVLSGYCQTMTKVIVYGSALDSITLKSGMMEYDAADQAKLSINVGPSASLTLNSDSIGAISGVISDGGSFTTDQTVLRSADLRVAANTYTTFESIDTLTLETPTFCNQDSTPIIDYHSLNNLVVNAQKIARSDEVKGCVSFNQN